MATYQGTGGNDTYSGTVNADTINGNGGNDTLSGNGGNDTIEGGSGNDTIDGGTGSDTARYRGTFADYTITWDSATRRYRLVDRLAGRDGTDWVAGVEFFRFSDRTLSFADLVPGMGDGIVRDGTAGTDTLVGDVGYDILRGLGGNDTLDGRGADDTLAGGDGDDLLIGGTGNDSLDGGSGTDRARFMGRFADYRFTWDDVARQYTVVDLVAGRDGTDTVRGVESFLFSDGARSLVDLVPGTGDGLVLTGTAGDDVLAGGIGYDVLRGEGGNDMLEGGGANDLLEGGAGDDRLVGGGGNDRLSGGDGFGDSAVFGDIRANYEITWDGVARQYTVRHLSSSAADGTDTVAGVEYFDFADGRYSIAHLVPDGGDGAELIGTAGDDVLVAGPGHDTLRGLAGKDLLVGGDGRDLLEGGEGDDRLEGGKGRDSLDGGAGTDRAVFAGRRSDYDVVWDANSRSYGLRDVSQAWDEVDVVRGVEYFEFADGVYSIAQLVPGQGDGVVLEGTGGNDILEGGVGYDTLVGHGGDDLLVGGDAGDLLRGGDGQDSLAGGAGNDILEGGEGQHDEARFSGYRADYDIQWDALARQYTIRDLRGGDGTDRVSGVEHFVFADGVRTIAQLLPGRGDGQVLTGTAWQDFLFGGEGYDVLRGGDSDDLLDGQGADDVLEGGSGNDFLAGGAGDDRIDGGEGSDVARFRNTFASYEIRWNASTRQYRIADRGWNYFSSDGTDLVSGVERFEFADGVRTLADLLPGVGDGVTLTGTPGSDMLAGGEGFDTLSGLAGHDLLEGHGADDVLAGGEGDDMLAGGQGNDRLEGGEGQDHARFTGNFWEYTITWNAATREYTVADRYFGRDGVDVVRGVERFIFQDGMRTIADLVPGMGDGVTLAGTPGDDMLAGAEGYDTLSGDAGHDLLEGNGAADVLVGGEGDDMLAGGQGNDRLDGGEGQDHARFSGNYWDYTITWDAATREYTVADRYFGSDGVDVVRGVERFIFQDGMRTIADLVPGKGDGVTVAGTPGDDMLAGGEGYDTLSGDGGHDLLEGNGADDVLVGGDGDDMLAGGQGNDRLDGGEGQDHARFSGNYWDYTITWDAATREYTVADRYFGSDGVDVVRGVERFIFQDGMRTIADLVPGVGDGVTLAGTPGDDMLAGAEGYDTLSGDGGHDLLEGNGAADVLSGGAGDDMLVGGQGDDRLDGGDGEDRARFSGYFSDYEIAWNALTGEFRIADRFFGRDGMDAVRGVELFHFQDGLRTAADLLPPPGAGVTLEGTGDADVLAGGIGNDTLSGLAGNDVLEGMEGNDVLGAGAGDDLLRGGAGNDWLDGGDGLQDRAAFSGAHWEYDIRWDAAAREYTFFDRTYGRDGVDVVRGVEFFSFANGLYSIAELLPMAGDGSVITGTAGDDWPLAGGAGYDTLRGLDGNDVLEGGDAGDVLEGGAGDDFLVGGRGDDRLDGGDGAFDRARFDGMFTEYDIRWNAATREYTIADRMGWRDGVDVARGVEFFQFADGTRSFADLVAGMGDGVVLAGTMGDDALLGGAGYDTLRGDGGNDTLEGGEADDVLDGGAGDDTLAGGQGNDAIAGGDGALDRALFSGMFHEYDVRWNAVTREYTVADRLGRDGIDVLRGVEFFSFADGTRSIADLVPGMGDGLQRTGTGGNDVLAGGLGYDTLRGLEGDDELDGGEADDRLEGGAGEDLLAAGRGNDWLDGGEGTHDRALFSGMRWEYDVRWNAGTREYTIADRVSGRDGVDVVRGVEFFSFADGTRSIADLHPGMGDGMQATGTAGGEWLEGGVGYDTLRGLEGDDRLDGGDADDVLEGGAGNDTLSGGQGNDFIDGGAGNSDRAMFRGAFHDYDIRWNTATREYTFVDRMTGRDGADAIRGVEYFSFLDGTRSIADLLPDVGDGVELAGTAGHDSLEGGAGHDVLVGLQGYDTLVGGAGNDLLDGGDDGDYLDGGAGADAYVLRGEGFDYVASFVSGEDRFLLAGADFAQLGTGTLAATAFQSGFSPVAMSQDTRIIFNAANGELLYDPDGAGGAYSVHLAMIATAPGAAVPSHTDFFVSGS